MLRLRVITALALLAVLLPSLWAPQAWPFAAFAFALAAAGTWEWGRLSGLQGSMSLVYAGVWGGGMAAFVWSQGTAVTLDSATREPVALLTGAFTVAWPVLLVLWALACLLLLPRGPEAWRRLPLPMRLVMGWVVMGSTWAALTGARQEGVNFLLSVMCVVWVSDISAYFAGHRWGRRKLAPTISPGKTWEGVMGAGVGVLVLAVVWMALERSLDLGSASVFTRSLQGWGPIGLLVVVAVLVALGIVGDLFESLIKRAAGVKDSSALLPGHGGVLDRVDALLPVMPAAMALLVLLMQTAAPMTGAR